MIRERTSQGRKVVIKGWGEAKGLNNKISNSLQKVSERAFGNSADLGSRVLRRHRASGFRFNPETSHGS